MPEKAQVTSLEALERFRSQLIVYLSQARPALEEVSADVLRLKLWLETDQPVFWEGQRKKRIKKLEEAQQALFSARLGSLRHETAADQLAVRRAKDAVEETELKLRTIQKWNRDFESRVQPQVKQMEKLHTVLTNDMTKAVAYLAEVIKILAAYADIQPATTTAGPPTPVSPPSEKPPGPATS